MTEKSANLPSDAEDEKSDGRSPGLALNHASFIFFFLVLLLFM